MRVTNLDCAGGNAHCATTTPTLPNSSGMPIPMDCTADWATVRHGPRGTRTRPCKDR